MTGNAAEKGFNLQPLSVENWHTWWWIVKHLFNFIALASNNSLCWLCSRGWLSWIGAGNSPSPPPEKPVGTAPCQHSRLSPCAHLLDFPDLEALTPTQDVGMFQMTLFVINKLLYVCESPCTACEMNLQRQILCCFPWLPFPLSAKHNTNGFPAAHRGWGAKRNQISFWELCLVVTKGVF